MSSPILAYRFDGTLYPNTESGNQELLEAISDAITTDCPDADPDSVWGNTHYAAPFDTNITALEIDSPTPLNIERVTNANITDDEREWL